MATQRHRQFNHLLAGASALVFALTPAVAHAQDEGAQPPAGPVAENADDGEAIVVTGIRASLASAMNTKKNAQGVVDAISAEDIGKFPDTNLAESLQRITGVSIDRNSGEGSTVTVRGFGPEYNLVLLNGRQMPTATLADGASPPSSRSFDFGALASEAVAKVEVYKSGRASLPTGGIGSVINIVTPRPLSRPGQHVSVAAKGVLDTSYNQGTTITPEFSGIYSNTFADDRIGIAVTGSFQRRKASVNQADIVLHGSFLGSENNWGTLSYGPETQNRPDANEVYIVPQNALYNITDLDRRRINGQAVLQVRPVDNLTATIDYTLSTNRVRAHTDTVGTWFNYGGNASAWTDGPTPGPLFYTEYFNGTKDLAYQGTNLANRILNKSLGGNLAWKSDTSGLRFEVDAHRSSAEAKPTNNFGSSNVIGVAIQGQAEQTLDTSEYLPVISITMAPGISATDPAQVQSAGSSFRNAYMRDEINELALRGGYDFDASIIDSLDFGLSITDNKVRSAFGVLQTDDWGSVLTDPGDLPAELFNTISIPDKFKGMPGADNPALIQEILGFDFDRMAEYLEDLNGICSASWSGTEQPGTCLANYTTDRRIREKSVAPYLQVNSSFDLLGNQANLRAGIRYEETRIKSSGLVLTPTNLSWVAANELQPIYGAGSSQSFVSRDGEYYNWLPAVDFDMSPMRDVKVRASYSHTVTRPNYADMQGGFETAAPYRIDGNIANVGDPNLLPYKSKNIDLSAEWYYGPSSYASVGFFNKKVANFIESARTTDTGFGLRTPFGGAAYLDAISTLGTTATFEQIQAYIATNYPNLIDPATGGILASPTDPLINFTVNTRRNSDQKARLYGWEFAVQHSFWDTGFGAIANYTIVKGDAVYDNTLPRSVTQFALPGLSNSANAVLYYDKNGLQGRIAYNWRDKFLAGFNGDGDPLYVQAYGQFDASASYEFKKGMTAFVEGINITNNNRRGHSRSERSAFFASKGYARYAAGLRLTF